jgi:hypothetical protein
MNDFNVFTLTLNIFAATIILSVGFSFRNFFAFFTEKASDGFFSKARDEFMISS